MSRYKPPINAIVLYECGHNRVYPIAHCPGVFESVICLKCNKPVMVARSSLMYRTRCRDCTHSQNHGASKLQAELLAVKHRRRRPTHTIDVFFGTEVIKTLKPQDTMIFTKALPKSPVIDHELPPF